tara:strand:- start:708 stop:2081 length:1374 start_codon:yes stop_codon:yes gene_type:complete
MKIYKLSIFILGLIFIPSSLFGGVPESFPFVKHIDGEVTPNKLYSILLDGDIWTHLNENKSNIRIFDDKKNEIPFLLKQKETYKKIKESVPVNAELVSMSHPKNNSIEIIFEFKHLKPIDFLEIKTKVQNFEKTITIYESNSQDKWKLLKKDTIFDYSAIINHRKLSVSLPKSNYKYLKIKLDNIVENSESPFISLSEKKDLTKKSIIQYRKTIYRKTFKVDQIIFYFSESKFIPNTKIETESITPSWSAQIKNEEDKNKTEIVADTVGAPLQAAVISTKGKIYGRPLIVQTFKPESEKWETISRLKLSTDRNNKALIPLKKIASRRLRFIIDNGDDQPAKITEFKLNRVLYQLIFLPDQKGSISAYFGGELSLFPTYDIQKYAETQDFIFELTSASLLKFNHPKKNNKEYIPETKKTTKRGYAFLFNTTLFLLVLVLVGVIAVVSKKMGITTDEKK